MKAFYDNKPSKLEAVGNGSCLYRQNIAEVTVENGTEEARSQWECEEVTVWSPVTANKITAAVITEKWDTNHEQKLVNEYNGALLGVYGAMTSDEAKEKIQAYTDYLNERLAVKTQVDADCKELGIE